MAISKKGLRKIVVADKTYYWRFTERIWVINEEEKRTLQIDFGWYDKWLYVNDKENRPPDFEPQTVTPKFVSSSILFAIENGWTKNNMQLSYRDGKYEITKHN